MIIFGMTTNDIMVAILIGGVIIAIYYALLHFLNKLKLRRLIKKYNKKDDKSREMGSDRKKSRDYSEYRKFFSTPTTTTGGLGDIETEPFSYRGSKSTKVDGEVKTDYGHRRL